MRPLAAIILGSVLLIGILLPGLSFGQNASPPAQASVLDNLQTAYADEMASRDTYLEFAKKADDEGYHQVASMFRATARSEEVHASNYADLIKAKGGTPQAAAKPPVVASTRENLEAAVAREDFQKDVQYPKFIRQAKQERDKSTEQCFNYARISTSGHAAMCDQALNALEDYRGGSQRFIICPHCGRMMVAAATPKCPQCATPREQFMAIN